MSTILPINLDDLLHCRGVESERVEFKGSWDDRTIGPQVLRTICAFANDYHNLNGGYVVIGVEEREGRAVLPPSGLSAEEVEAAQRWIRGNCNRLDPPYPPILSPELVDDRLVLVIWAPASEMRPHRAPAPDGPGRYWVRLGGETADAERRGDMLRGLIQQTARVPWDDRRAADAEVEDLREAKVREFLRDMRSGLLEEPDEREIYRRMRLTVRVNDHETPRNAGLLFFSNDPTQWFRGAKIEVVQFAADRPGDVQEERTFGGALMDQLRDCLTYLQNLSTVHLQKQRDRSQVRGWVSYPGPVPGIEPRHLLPDAEVRAVPARNRRIGELLKELGLAEGRLSGLPKVFEAMAANGSPAPRFEFDEQRTYFQTTLPAHPEFGALSALRDAAHLRALGEPDEALRRMASAWVSNPGSAVLASEIIREYAARGEIGRAEKVLETFETEGPAGAVAHVANILIEALLEAGEEGKAQQLLRRSDPMSFSQEAIDAAILARRARDFRVAHRLFERAGDTVHADPRALLEFAQTKLVLASEAHRQRRHALNRRFLMEAWTLMERVIQLDATPTRHAWAWRELARTLRWLRAPWREVDAAYRRAIDLLPEERRFAQEWERIRASRG